MREWTAGAERLVDVIGADSTTRLIERFGGELRIYVPQKPSTSHRWLAVLSPVEFARVCKEFGGKHISLPKHATVELKKRRILEMLEAGVSVRNVAKACDTSERYVYSVASGLGPDPRQLNLF